MRIWTFSDLHVDVCPWAPPVPPPSYDVVVVAGDVCERLSRRAIPWLSLNLAGHGRPILYCPGNHDFYGVNVDVEPARAVEAAAANGVVLLSPSTPFVYEGVRFVGCTLWTDYAVHGSAALSIPVALGTMNDHRRIRAASDYRRFNPVYARMLHRRQLADLVATLSTPHDGPTVVVTHHAPLRESLDDRIPPGPLDGAYASDLSVLVAETAPDLWIHGHVHRRRDYRFARTRVVANPRGYVVARRMGKAVVTDVEVPDFDPAYVVEV